MQPGIASMVNHIGLPQTAQRCAVSVRPLSKRWVWTCVSPRVATLSAGKKAL